MIISMALKGSIAWAHRGRGSGLQGSLGRLCSWLPLRVGPALLSQAGDPPWQCRSASRTVLGVLQLHPYIASMPAERSTSCA